VLMTSLTFIGLTPFFCSFRPVGILLGPVYASDA
jgi:hypothetical protein